MALRETLVRLKRQQEDAVSFEADKPRLREEWIQAVESLLQEFKIFLAPFEADGSLTFQSRTVSRTEDMLGTYAVSAATIEAGQAKIDITPVGRLVVGAIGRVDLSRQGHPGSAERILILRRYEKDPEDWHWILRMPEGWDTPRLSKSDTGRWVPVNYEFLSFDRDNIEKAIDFLLSL